MKPRTVSRRAATNLQGAAASFVGRTADVAALAQRFEQGRLVTIVGPGGMGKTRLALRYAEGHRAGVWFCDLSEARGAAEIVASVAAALGVPLVGLGSDAAGAETVGRAIARRGRVLVVLDNFDRLAAHAAGTVGLWLRAAPGARFLATSRVPLDVTGELLWPLAPLSRDEAVELFVRRARDVQPAFDPAGELATLGQIVDAVDRMPLAIELAATRMTVLSTGQLRARLERPLEVLAGRREVARHASMRRTVLDSVDLLDAGARRLFATLAVLRNGFTLEAAEAILGDVSAPRAAVMDGLETLVRTSLLRVSVEPGDAARYGFFATIRDVAEEAWAPDPSREELLARHADYYAALCARLGSTALAPAAELAHVARELENLLFAHENAVALASRAHSPAHAAAAVAIARGLEPLLSARGLSRLRARLFDEALAALEAVGSGDEGARAEAHLGRGLARRELGDAPLARDDFEHALELARRAGDPGLAAVALTRLGGARDLVGDTNAARASFDEALALLAAAPRGALRTRREAEAYLRLGHAHRREGALSLARTAIGEAVERYRQLDHDEGLASALYELAIIEMFAEAHDVAFARFDEGVRVAQRGGIRVMLGALKTARGCLLQDLGRLDEALEHHAEAARIFRELGSRYREASALYYLATTYLERGDAAEAEAVLRGARARLEGVGAPRYEALTAGCMAGALAALGRGDDAERAMAEAESAAARVRNEPALACNVRVHRLALELRARGWRDAAAVIAQAEALVATCANDDSRFALRALRAAARGEAREAGADALVVWDGGRCFTLPGSAEVVTLPERSPQRRILEHLARRRLEAPGEVVSVDEVIRVGWPAEKIGAEAALNRAYVALALLRKRGLRGLLVSVEGGYALSQAVVVRLENKAR